MDNVVLSIPLVQVLAKAMVGNMHPSVCVDDLVQDGVVALIRAAQRFNPSRGNKFWTFAEHSVGGAMKESVRRRRGRHLYFEKPVGTVLAIDKHLRPLVTWDPESDWDLKVAMSALTRRKQAILKLYYFEGWTDQRIATLIGVKRSRVCQIRSEALKQLRKMLGR